MTGWPFALVGILVAFAVLIIVFALYGRWR